MGLDFEIRYHELVIRDDIPRISSGWKSRIQSAIETKLGSFPDLYGKPLHLSLHGYFKLRVGDYRVIYKIENPLVKILIIQHRSKVYEAAEKRFERKR